MLDKPAPEFRNIHQRMAAVMAKVAYIQKEKKAGMRYSIVSHDSVTAKVRPLMVEHGIIYYPMHITRSQSGNRTEVDMIVRFVNIDDPMDNLDVYTTGYGIDDQDKGPGKAMSYAVKYALLKALGLESGDDPDEDQDTPHLDFLAKGLITAMSLATTADELAEVAQQIKTKAADLPAVQQQILRTEYKKRLAAVSA